MNIATILALFKLFLELAVMISRRVTKAEVEDALLEELNSRHKARVDAAARARDDVMSGRVPDNPGVGPDPYERES